MTDRINASATSPRANLSLGLGVAAIAVQIIAMIANGDGDAYGWLWFVMAALALGALATGFTARVDRRIPGRAFIGMVIGALLVLLFLLFALGILE
jgi:hypothetical protein